MVVVLIVGLRMQLIINNEQLIIKKEQITNNIKKSKTKNQGEKYEVI